MSIEKARYKFPIYKFHRNILTVSQNNTVHNFTSSEFVKMEITVFLVPGRIPPFFLPPLKKKINLQFDKLEITGSKLFPKRHALFFEEDNCLLYAWYFIFDCLHT